jgi:hypothetical protein
MERHSPPTDGVHRDDPPADDPLREPYDPRRSYQGHRSPPRGAGLDPSALFVLLDGLRRLVPRELEGQLTNLIREFLLTLRALIDWYLDRLERPPREPRVEDIPID